MNDTLSFHKHLLAKGTHLVRLGQLAEGRELLQILLAGEDAPLAARAKARCLLGEMEFNAGHFRNARRHYAAAMSLRPYDAEACLAYYRAIHADPDANPNKGYAACRRATKIDPTEPRFWTALGHSAIHAGQPFRAIKAFRRAAKLQPETQDVLADVIDGFISLGRTEEAIAVLSAARFRSPKNPSLARLQERLGFEIARRNQERKRSESENPDDAVLSFSGRPTEAATSPNPLIVRADRRSRSIPHVLRMFGMRSGPRQAN
jgi:tetratricopeptide (TPR) repeat protein